MTKKHKKKMHAAAWSPAARRKRKANLKARRAAKAAGEVWPAAEAYAAKKGYARKGVRTAVDPTHDVIVFLEHAEAAILKSGAKRITAAESYAMLALTTLRGN